MLRAGGKRRVWLKPDKPLEKRGAANRTRTCDPVITNDVLYQLRYCGGPKRRSPVSERPHLISGTAPIGKIIATAER